MVTIDHAKMSFCRLANGIFGKVGRIASEEVVLCLITSKCLPVLLYGLEVCPLSKSDLQSLDFVVNRLLMKLFKTSNYDIICECRNYLCFCLQVNCWQNVMMYSWLNSVVSNRRMTVIA